METQENSNNSRASTGSRRGTWSRAEGVGLTVIRDSLSQELLRPHIRFLYFQGLGKMFQTFKSWRAGYEGRSWCLTRRERVTPGRDAGEKGSAKVAEFAGNDSVKKNKQTTRLLSVKCYTEIAIHIRNRTDVGIRRKRIEVWAWKKKGLSEREVTSIYLRSIRVAIWDTVIQADAQMVFWCGGKGEGCLWGRAGGSHARRREALPLVPIM